MTTRLYRVLAASLASLVLFSGISVSAATRRPVRHRATISRSQSHHSTSVRSRATHRRVHRTVKRHRTVRR